MFVVLANGFLILSSLRLVVLLKIFRNLRAAGMSWRRTWYPLNAADWGPREENSWRLVGLLVIRNEGIGCESSV